MLLLLLLLVGRLAAKEYCFCDESSRRAVCNYQPIDIVLTGCETAQSVVVLNSEVESEVKTNVSHKSRLPVMISIALTIIIDIVSIVTIYLFGFTGLALFGLAILFW